MCVCVQSEEEEFDYSEDSSNQLKRMKVQKKHTLQKLTCLLFLPFCLSCAEQKHSLCSAHYWSLCSLSSLSLYLTLFSPLCRQRYMVLVPEPASGKPRPGLCDGPAAADHAARKRDPRRPPARAAESSSQCERRVGEHGGSGREAGGARLQQ